MVSAGFSVATKRARQLPRPSGYIRHSAEAGNVRASGRGRGDYQTRGCRANQLRPYEIQTASGFFTRIIITVLWMGNAVGD